MPNKFCSQQNYDKFSLLKNFQKLNILIWYNYWIHSYATRTASNFLNTTCARQATYSASWKCLWISLVREFIKLTFDESIIVPLPIKLGSKINICFKEKSLYPS